MPSVAVVGAKHEPLIADCLASSGTAITGTCPLIVTGSGSIIDGGTRPLRGGKSPSNEDEGLSGGDAAPADAVPLPIVDGEGCCPGDAAVSSSSGSAAVMTLGGSGSLVTVVTMASRIATVGRSDDGRIEEQASDSKAEDADRDNADGGWDSSSSSEGPS